MFYVSAYKIMKAVKAQPAKKIYRTSVTCIGLKNVDNEIVTNAVCRQKVYRLRLKAV